VTAIRPRRGDRRAVAVETVAGGAAAVVVVQLVDGRLGLPPLVAALLAVGLGLVVAVFVGLRSGVRREQAAQARGRVWVRPRGDMRLRDVWGVVWVCQAVDGRLWHPDGGGDGVGPMGFGDLLQERGPLAEHREGER
jgi:hypothetical protein